MPNFWGGFRALNSMSRDLLGRNLVQANTMASLRMVTPRAEFCGVTRHNVKQAAKGHILKITLLLHYCR